jgi:hypothetical protein
VWDQKNNLKDLPFSSKAISIAPLLCTIHLKATGIEVEPRHHPYCAPTNCPIIGVFRIESPKRYTFLLSQNISESIVMVISSYQKQLNLKEIQIDFDAAKSERLFYIGLLNHMRKIIPQNVKISITGLASWFAFDKWWKELPIDEIVFMFYDIKVKEKPFYQSLLKNPANFLYKPKISIGFCVQDPFNENRYKGAYRTFWFNRIPWDISAKSDI